MAGREPEIGGGQGQWTCRHPISAGVGALISAVPTFLPHTVAICLSILLVITLVNLRGLRESGVVFMIPTYLFIGCMITMIAIGVVHALLGGAHPKPIETMPAIPPTTAVVSAWMLLQVFSSGCAAMTGVEAVSNGVKAFREPTGPNAQRTLTVIIAILMVLLLGIAYLCTAYGIGATYPEKGYESVLSMLMRAVAGKGLFYWISIGSILLVLSLSANTAFADFLRLCRIIARDDYLPHSFASTGRRLVYSQGIFVLAVLTAGILILFGGVTDRLIPLYAVGAFLAFTLSQSGMVLHWRRQGPGHLHSMIVNAVGACATAITTIVVLAAKFVQGAWLTVILIPVIVLLMRRVRHHYDAVAAETACPRPADFTQMKEPLVIAPLATWNRISENALRFAYTISREIRAVHISAEGETSSTFCQEWPKLTDESARKAGLPPPELVVLGSPYRWVLRPILEYVLEVERQHPDREIVVVLPEMVERNWYHYFMHNQRAQILKAWLMVRGSRRIIVVNVPWYLKQ